MAIWASLFDNTKWQPWAGNPAAGAVWDGSAWDSVIASGRDYVSLQAIGGWNVGSKDHITKVRVTWTQEDPKDDLWLYDTTATSFTNSAPIRFLDVDQPLSATEYNITFQGVDLEHLVVRNHSFEAAFKITNIEFFGDFTEPSKKIKSLFQFSKGERSEIYTYAQYDVGCVRAATNNPPAVTTGPFGNGVFSSAGDLDNLIPAHWGVLKDILMFSDGIDQHQIFPGLSQKVGGFVVTNQFATLPRIPETGKDYTDQVLESNIDFPTFGMALQAGDAVFVMTPVPANTLSWIFNAASGGNNLLGDLHMRYVDEAGDFQEVANFVDGTHDGTRSFSADGDMTWDKPADEFPTYMFGQSGYWYKMDFLGEAGISVTTATPRQILYSGEWRAMQNVWDGILIDVTEAEKKVDGTPDVFETYPASSINISGFVAAADELYLSCADLTYGFYFDVGNTVNTVTGTVILIDFWTGDTWTNIAIQDGTLGFTRSGFITWSKTHLAKKSNFNDSRWHSFWYRLRTTGVDTSDNVIISALNLPVYDINREFGEFGITNTPWKNRACYTSSIFDRDIYVSANGRLNVLNGSDFAILEPGDGRRNRTVCMKKFHNEIIAWQEEKGRDGGCTTLFEGYNPATFGKLVLSSQVGTFSAKSAVVIDGATTVTRNDDKYQTMAYWISHYGIFMSDGQIVTLISQDIQNYFDTDFAECIRLGFEENMWVEHDQDRGVLRFGLVSGDTEECPNVFPVFDLEDGTWSFDTFEDPLHHLTHALQIEAETGQFPIIHIGAAVDGFVYLLNEGLNDNGDAIDYHLRIEMNNTGFMLNLREANIRMRVQAAGTLQKEIYENNKKVTIESATLDMTELEPGDGMVRQRIFERVYEETNISIEFREDTIDQAVYLYDINIDIGSILNK